MACDTSADFNSQLPSQAPSFKSPALNCTGGEVGCCGLDGEITADSQWADIRAAFGPAERATLHSRTPGTGKRTSAAP